MSQFFAKRVANKPPVKSRISASADAPIPSCLIARLAKILWILMFAILFAPSVLQAESVTLGWDPSLDPSVAGYNVYYGNESGYYTNVTSIGNVTNTEISGLLAGATYYFALTAYDASGLESDFSNEISYTVPIPSQVAVGQLKLAPSTGGAFNLTSAGIPGHTYEIQVSTDLATWTIITTQTVGPSGAIQFTDNDAANYPVRFYRTRDTQ